MRIDEALKYFHGNQSALAKAAGVSRQCVHNWINRDERDLLPPAAAVNVEISTKGRLRVRARSYKR